MGTLQIVVNSIYIILIFSSILFIAYVSTKYIGKKAGRVMKGKYIKPVESMSLGIDKTIHLVKAGDKHILISSSGKNIQYLTAVEITEEEQEEITDNISNGFDFKSIFDKYTNNFINKKKQQHNSSEGEDKKTFSENLSRIKEITSRHKKMG